MFNFGTGTGTESNCSFYLPGGYPIRVTVSVTNSNTNSNSNISFDTC